MKQICGSIRCLVVTVMILTSLFPCAMAEQAAYESGNFRYILRDDGAQITGLADDRKDLLYVDSPLFIPDTLDGHPVVSIGEGAFTGVAMSDVQIPDGIIEICARAFEYCAIKSINIPQSVKSLGMRAFANCYQLEDISIPGNVECIGESAFEACNNLMSVILLSGVKNVGDYAFRNCAQLRTVMIGESVEEMGINPFAGCDNLQFYVSMSHPFLKANGQYLFDSLTGKLISYTGAPEEDSFIVPEEITHIGIASFYGASWLQHIIIPDHVEQIGSFAFLECGNLISVQIGSGVLSVGDNPFGRCWSIAEIEVNAENPYLKVTDGVLFSVQDKRLVSYPPAHASYLYSVPDGILHIGNYAFSNAENLREICLPASIITIGRGAFCNCTDLAYINIPDGIHSLGDVAFAGCSSLCEVTLPDLYTIGKGAFQNCELLKLSVIEGSYAEAYAISEGVPFQTY